MKNRFQKGNRWGFASCLLALRSPLLSQAVGLKAFLRCETDAGGFKLGLNATSVLRKGLAPRSAGGELGGWDVFSGMRRGGR